MYSLGTSQTLNGFSSNATVTYTVSGLLMSSASPPVANTYEVLAQGTLPSTTGVIYNPGGSATAVIANIALFNWGGTQQVCNLYIEGSATPNQIATLTIPAGGWAEYEQGVGWTIYTSGGLVLTTQSTFGLMYPGAFTGAIADTMPVAVASTNVAVLATGQITLQPIEIAAGQTIGHIAFSSMTTAASTPTNYWFTLCDLNRNLLAITANQTTTAWAATTLKSLAIANTAAGAATTFTTTYSGVYFLGIMMTATTVISMVGASPTTSLTTGGVATQFGGKSTSGLTTPSTFPTQYAAIAANASAVWGEVAP